MKPLSLRRFSTAATVYTAVSTIGKAVTFLLVPFYTHIIPPDEFGVYSSLFPFYAVMLMIFQYGMPSAIIKFYNEAKSHDEKKSFVSTLFALQTSTALGFGLVLFLLSPFLSFAFTGSDLYSNVIYLIIISLCIETLGFNLLWIIRSDNRLGLFALISLVSLAINIGMTLWLVPQGNYVFNLFLAQVVSVLFTFGVAILFNLSLFKIYFDKALAQKLWRYGYPLLGYGVLAVLLDSADKVIVTRFISKEAGGIYSVGYRLGMVMSILNVSFRTALLPFYAQRVEQYTLKENELLFIDIFSLYTTGLTVLFLSLSFFVRDLMTLQLFGYSLFKETYFSAAQLTPIVLLAYLVSSPTEFSKAALTKSGDTKLLFSAMLYSLILNLFLIAGIIALPIKSITLTLQLIAFATVVAYCFNLIYFRLKCKSIDRTPYPILRFVLLVVIACVAVFLNESYLFDLIFWKRLVICCIVSTIIVFIGLFPMIMMRLKGRA